MTSFHANAAIIAQEIVQTLARMDEVQIEIATELILQAKRIFVIGVGREGLASRSFAMRLMHLGLEVHLAWDDTTPAIDSDDLLVMVNGSGQIGHLDYVFAQVVATGAKTLVITGVPHATTPTAATAMVQVPASVYRGEGDLVKSIQPMGSLFEQCVLIALDLLILELVNRLDLTFADLALRHRNFE